MGKLIFLAILLSCYEVQAAKDERVRGILGGQTEICFDSLDDDLRIYHKNVDDENDRQLFCTPETGESDDCSIQKNSTRNSTCLTIFNTTLADAGQFYAKMTNDDLPLFTKKLTFGKINKRTENSNMQGRPMRYHESGLSEETVGGIVAGIFIFLCLLIALISLHRKRKLCFHQGGDNGANPENDEGPGSELLSNSEEGNPTSNGLDDRQREETTPIANGHVRDCTRDETQILENDSRENISEGEMRIFLTRLGDRAHWRKPQHQYQTPNTSDDDATDSKHKDIGEEAMNFENESDGGLVLEEDNTNVKQCLDIDHIPHLRSTTHLDDISGLNHLQTHEYFLDNRQVNWPSMDIIHDGMDMNDKISVKEECKLEFPFSGFPVLEFYIHDHTMNIRISRSCKPFDKVKEDTKDETICKNSIIVQSSKLLSTKENGQDNLKSAEDKRIGTELFLNHSIQENIYNECSMYIGLHDIKIWFRKCQKYTKMKEDHNCLYKSWLKVSLKA